MAMERMMGLPRRALLAFACLLYILVLPPGSAAQVQGNIPDSISDEFTPAAGKKWTGYRDIVLPPGFKVDQFYAGPDGIAVRHDGALLVVNEGKPQGVFIARKGDTFDLEDAFSTTGLPFKSPDDILIHPDGTVFVADGNVGILFRISADLLFQFIGTLPRINLRVRKDDDAERTLRCRC